MERYITDELYHHSQHQRSAEVELAEKRLYKMLSTLIAEKDYILLEEEVTRLCSIVEREFFYYGFTEGVRFLMKCL